MKKKLPKKNERLNGRVGCLFEILPSGNYRLFEVNYNEVRYTLIKPSGLKIEECRMEHEPCHNPRNIESLNKFKNLILEKL